jgi:hypothetical protein
VTLRFNRSTNLFGLVGSLAFMFAGIYVAMRGTSALGTPLFAAAAGAWILLTAASYFLRGIEVDSGVK